VVDAWQLKTWDEYRDVSRLGRRTRIGGKQREALWAVFEHAEPRGVLAQRRQLGAQAVAGCEEQLDPASTAPDHQDPPHLVSGQAACAQRFEQARKRPIGLTGRACSAAPGIASSAGVAPTSTDSRS
jgi:hypothetical protein